MGDLFGGGKKKTKVAPPAYAQPYLEKGLQESARLYQTPKPVVPFSPDSTQAQDMIRDRSTNGDPTIDAASKYVRDSLGGSFLNSNPYIDATFEKARLATQGGIASEYARSGRNVEASEHNRSQQLNDLATSIYGGNYANERQLMQGVMPYAQPLGNQAYTDAGALSASGAQQEQKAQDVADAPYKALDDYLDRIGSVKYGSEQTDTEQADPLTTIAGGLLAAPDLLGAIKGVTGGGIFGSATGAAPAAMGINGAVPLGGAAPLFGGGAAAGPGFGAGALAAGGSALGATTLGAPLATGGLMSAGGAAGALTAAGEASGAGAAAALGGGTAGGGFGAAALAAAPWVAAALGVGAVIANNVAKSSPLDGFKVEVGGWTKPQNFDNTRFQPEELNAYFGPAVQKFAQTGDAQAALAALPKPRNAREEIMLKGGAKALFGGTGNPFRQIAKAKGFGEGIWTAGNKDKKAAIKGLSGGMFGSPMVGISNPAPARAF